MVIQAIVASVVFQSLAWNYHQEGHTSTHQTSRLSGAWLSHVQLTVAPPTENHCFWADVVLLPSHFVASYCYCVGLFEFIMFVVFSSRDLFCDNQ